MCVCRDLLGATRNESSDSRMLGRGTWGPWAGNGSQSIHLAEASLTGTV